MRENVSTYAGLGNPPHSETAHTNMHNFASSSQCGQAGVGDDDRDDATEGMDFLWFACLAFDERSVTIPMHLIEKYIEELANYHDVTASVARVRRSR